MLAEVVNGTDDSLNAIARNTRGSRQTIPWLEQGTLDVALVASLPARAEVPEALAYRLIGATHKGQPKLPERLTRGRDTLPRNTWKAAGDPDRIHPGARRYLAQLGLK